MKWLLILAGIIGCFILIVMILGCFLPVRHTATVKVSVSSTPDKVWQRLADFRSYPVWRSDVKAIEVLSDSEWIEVNERNHKLPLKLIVKEPISRLIMKINGNGLPFGGDFECVLHPEGGRTIVTITENGAIYNPAFRFVSRFIIGYSATAKKYGDNLQRSFIAHPGNLIK